MKIKLANIAVLTVAFALWAAVPTAGNASPLTLLATSTTGNQTGGEEGGEEGGHAVPDAGATALLLGSALGGLALVRRFLKR